MGQPLHFPSISAFSSCAPFLSSSASSSAATHSVLQISFFVTLCEGFLGCPPYFPLWLALFHGRAQRKKPEDGGELIASGGITFQLISGKSAVDSYLKAELSGKAESTWRKKWFYYREVTPDGEIALPMFTMEPSRPRRLHVRRLPEAAESMVELMLGRLRELKDDGLKAVNVYSCWVGRHLPPLRARPRLMCDYTGQYDNARTFHESWSAEEYERIVTSLTKADFVSLDAPLKAFDSMDNPLPTVS